MFEKAVIISRKKIFIQFFFFVKMLKTLSAKYYQKNKERLQMKVGERYQGLPENEKNKILDFGHER